MLLHAFVISALSLAVAASDPDSDCSAPEGSHALLSDTAGRLMLVGETHGSEQPPAFVRSLVCLSLARGESLTLALEIAHTEQAELEAWLAAERSEDATRQYVEASRFWNSRFRDGRSSHAMLALLEYVRDERNSGADIAILAADYHPETDPDETQDQFVRDRVMARRLEEVAGQADRTIFLGGNIHTRRVPMDFHGQTLETIGGYIEQTEFVSVLAMTGAGETWNCRMTEDGESDCGRHQGGADFFTGSPRVLSDEEFEQSPVAEFYRDGYDYLVFLGPSTASLPVVPLEE